MKVHRGTPTGLKRAIARLAESKMKAMAILIGPLDQLNCYSQEGPACGSPRKGESSFCLAVLHEIQALSSSRREGGSPPPARLSFTHAVAFY